MRYISVVLGIILGAALIFAVRYWQADDSRIPAPESPGQESIPAAESSATLETEVETTRDEDETGQAHDEVSSEHPEEPAEAVPVPVEEETLGMDESDAYVSERLAAWDLPASWVAREAMVSRAAVVLTNAVRGSLPRRQLRFMVPAEGYPVRTLAAVADATEEERYLVDESGFRRYDDIVRVVTAIDPRAAAELAHTVMPLIEEAMLRLGERGDAEAMLKQCMAQIERFRYPSGDIELVRPNVLYEYADPELEALSDIEKQLLRLGPENLARVQAFVEAFSTALVAIR